MLKKLIPLIIIIALVIVILGGCETFKYGPVQGGDADAVVTNNGGLAVLQGEYLYFINGQAGYDAENPNTNFFGNVLKGAVMRGKLVGGELTDVEVVVPKKVMASSPDTGIYVFGEWIYYVSPSTGTDNRGNVLTDYIDFFRTSIDGTRTQKITTIRGNTTRFKYTPDALIYYKDKELRSIDLTSKKFTETLIDEEVVSILFPSNPEYNPESPESLANYVFYTKTAESDLDANNVVYAVNANGSDKKILIDKDTYTNNPQDLTKIYTISLLGSSVTNNKLAIYYTKTTIASQENTAKGLYGYEFNGTTLEFNKANEKQFSISNPTKIYPISFEKGVFLTEENPKILAKYKQEGEIAPSREQYEFESSITFLGVSELNGKDYIYYLSSNKILRMPLDKSENAAIIVSDKTLSWVGPDFIGNFMFYVNDSDYKYTYMVKLDTFVRGDDDALFNELIGQMTEEDIEAKEEAEENK